MLSIIKKKTSVTGRLHKLRSAEQVSDYDDSIQWLIYVSVITYLLNDEIVKLIEKIIWNKWKYALF